MNAIISIVLACAGLAAQGESGKDVIKKVQDRYKKLKTLEVAFDYHFQWKLTGKQQSLTGKLFFKKENFIRYELGQQLNVTDGETVWQYSEANNQVIVDRLKKNSKSLFLPKYFLFEYLDKFVAEIIQTETIKGRAVYVIKMNPKDKDDFVQSMKVWIPADSWLTERVEYTDLEGNVISYAFTHVATDVFLEEKLFTFKTDAGMDVIDLR
jgi:outer membrane lipoprotein-sorting protein